MSTTAAPSAPGERRLSPDALPAALRRYVREVYELPFPVDPTGSYRIPVSANVTPILNVTRGGTVGVTFADGSREALPAVLLSGPQPDAYLLDVDGTVAGFYVTFAAAGPLALLGVRRYWRGGGAAPPLASLVRPALAHAVEAYEAALLAAPDFETRASLTLALLREGLSGAPAADVSDADLLQRAADAIDDAEGRIRVEGLARMLGVSAPTLRRRFATMGMTVKRFADVVRFRHAHAFLHTTPGATWADVVDRYGYSDQAHVVRSYRRLAGVTPTRWDAGARPVDLRLGIETPTAPPDPTGAVPDPRTRRA